MIPGQPQRTWQPTIGVEVVLVAALLALVCILAWPGMTAPLHVDDTMQLKHDELFTSWRDCFSKDVFQYFRPAKNLVFHALRGLPLFSGNQVFSAHAISLVSYLCATLAVQILFRRLLDSFVWAFAATTLWATCPTQVCAVVWLSCANISLAIALSCACVALHDRSREKSCGNILAGILSGLCLFLALCSYETAIATPVFCVIVDSMRKRQLFSRDAMARYVMLGTITVVYLVIRSRFGSLQSAQYQNYVFLPETQAWQLSVSAPWFLWRHLSMWLLPPGRIEAYSTYLWGISATAWDLAAAWVFLLMVISVVMLTRKRQPWVAFGLLWYLAASFPTSNFIPVWAGPIEDYYVVFPSIGLAIALAGFARWIFEWTTSQRANGESGHRIVGGSILLTLLCWRLMCVPLFWIQAELWNRPADLFLRMELTRPKQFMLQNVASEELLELGLYKEAGELAAKSRETAPWFPSPTMVLAGIALENSKYAEAEKLYREALGKCSGNSTTRDTCVLQLARSMKRGGASPLVIRDILKPLLDNTSSPLHLDAIWLQIHSYMTTGQGDDARRAATKAVRMHPEIKRFNDLLAEINEKFPPSPAPSQPRK